MSSNDSSCKASISTLGGNVILAPPGFHEANIGLDGLGSSHCWLVSSEGPSST